MNKRCYLDLGHYGECRNLTQVLNEVHSYIISINGYIMYNKEYIIERLFSRSARKDRCTTLF